MQRNVQCVKQKNNIGSYRGKGEVVFIYEARSISGGGNQVLHGGLHKTQYKVKTECTNKRERSL